MAGRSFDTPRGQRALGVGLESFRNQLDSGRARSLPRVDLALNPDTLTTMQEVKQADLNYTADTMKYGDYAHIGFSVGTTGNNTPILTRPSNKRIFLLIENTHATQSLFVGFGIVPGSTIGITIAPGGNLMLDNTLPQNDVYLAGSGAATTGKLTYSNQDFGRG
jgi:hypothetical protein